MKICIKTICILLVWSAVSSCNRCKFGCENGICLKRQCQCDLFWEGDACERITLRKYEGEYEGSDTCIPNSKQKFLLSTDPSELGSMQLNGNLKLNFRDSARFDILPQPYAGQMVEGEGQMLSESISFNYHWNDSFGQHFCIVQAELIAEI